MPAFSPAFAPAPDPAVEALFHRPDQRVTLAEGEVLLRQGDPNERLFRVEEGMVTGIYSADGAYPQEIFRAGPGMFVGVQSFFSGSFTMLLTVQAVGATTLSYITHDQIPDDEATFGRFAAHFLPVVVRELYAREIAGQQMAHERQRQLKSALLQEKMVALGQMAQGLAHELNNAVGVMNSKTEWLSDRLEAYLTTQPHALPFFERGLTEGVLLSTRDIRARRERLRTRLGLEDTLAADLARTGIPDDALHALRRDPKALRQALFYWDLGSAFHDLRVASQHAVSVVASIRELGRDRAHREANVDLNATLRQALTLCSPLLKSIRVTLELPDPPMHLPANASELVQVWMNLIKNAAEALLEHGTPNPHLTIRARQTPRHAHIHVIDNGPGIPEDVRASLFVPNFTTKREGNYVGMGLGLSIVEKIVTSYQGRVWVETRPGETAFKVKIPNQPTEAAAPTEVVRDPNV